MGSSKHPFIQARPFSPGTLLSDVQSTLSFKQDLSPQGPSLVAWLILLLVCSCPIDQNFSLSAVSELVVLKAPEVLALDAQEDLDLNAHVSLEVNNPPEDQALDVLKIMEETLKMA